MAGWQIPSPQNPALDTGKPQQGGWPVVVASHVMGIPAAAGAANLAVCVIPRNKITRVDINIINTKTSVNLRSKGIGFGNFLVFLCLLERFLLVAGILNL
jgi:hypothetical protein